MTVENITISNISIWLTIDQLRMYSADRSRIESRQEYLCYFKLSEPTPMIIGELFRDTENKPMLFSSVEDAISFATRQLTMMLK
jgi:hypothetical protein